MVAPLSIALYCAVFFGGDGDWPEPRYDARLTAVQPLAGGMAEAPVVVARHSLPATPQPIAAALSPEVDGTPRGLVLASGAVSCYAAPDRLVWRAHPGGLNFDAIASVADSNGDGTAEILLKAGRPAIPYGAAVLLDSESGATLWRYDVEPMSYSWTLHSADYVPESPGLEIVVLMMGYPPDSANGYIALFSWKNGVLAQRWRYDFDAYTCFPSLLTPDLDGDGTREIAVETHSRMWIFDADTGEKRHFFQWDTRPANVRSYGLIRFVDLDRDSREDFLCIADFAQHHEVLLNRGGLLEEAWHCGWPESVTTGKVATYWPEPPYADLDGDATLELVVSMFNADGENGWTIRVYDAVTGAIKTKCPGVVAVALHDCDGDGNVETIARSCQDPERAMLGAAQVLAWRGESLSPVFSGAGAVVERPAEGVAPTWLLDGNPAELSYAEDTYSLRLKPPVPPAADPKPAASVWKSIPAARLPLPEVYAADVNGDGKNEILLYADEKLTVCSQQGDAFSPLSVYGSSAMPVIADLDGDGSLEIVTCTVAPNAAPVLRAVTPSRNDAALWETAVPPPGRTGLPQPRKAYLRAGHFLGRAGNDVYFLAGIPLVRSMVFHGGTGELAWERGETPGLERYWAPTVNLAAAWDFNGDGAEDLVFTNPDYYCIAAGDTGEALLGPLFPPTIFDQPSQGLYTLPALLERGAERPLVLLTNGHYFQASMTLDAAPYWHRIPVPGANRCAAEGFIKTPREGWLMGFGRQDGLFECVEAQSGVTRWTYPLEAAAGDTIGGDVDGDGMPEFVIATSHGTLYALGDAEGKPRVLWRSELGAPLGNPILADSDGDGKSEILVVGMDGLLRVLDAK